MEMKKIDYMLDINILRNSSPKVLGVLRGAFKGFGCPKRHPDAVLAKTMATILAPLPVLPVSLDISLVEGVYFRHISLTKVYVI